MAKKGLFGRLADAVKNTVSRLFGRSKDSNNSASSTDAELEAQRNRERIETAKRLREEREREEREREERIQREREREERIRQEREEREREERFQREERERERKLDSLREKYSSIISEANQRWELIENEGLQSMAISRALDENGTPYFSIDLQDNENDIIKEVTRANVFLADQTSTIEGARLYTAEIGAERFRGKFGKEWATKDNNNRTFDTSTIDEEYAKEVFRSYRMLEETKQGLIMAYGSENLIIAMYDAKVRGEDPYTYGSDVLSAWYTTKQSDWDNRFETARAAYEQSRSYEHGTVEDYINGKENHYDGYSDDELYF